MKKWLALSLILHLAILGIFSLRSRSNAPLGVDLKGDPTVVDLLNTRSSVSAPKARSIQKSAPEVVEVEKDTTMKAEKPKESAQATASDIPNESFGSRTGTATSGLLGRADGIQATERERYLYELRMLIEGRKIYPASSKVFKETGRVVVKFNILRDGKIQQVEVIDQSRFARLNNAAVSLISDIRQYKPLPDAVPDKELVVHVPIEYKLN